MIVVVIPTYNEAEKIASVLRGIPYGIDRILVVNDGSNDATKSVVAREGARDKRIVPLLHERNFGMGKALRTGILHAFRQLQANVIVTLDADGEHDPSELPKLLDRLSRDGADLVLGQRDRTRMPIGRACSIILNAALIRMVCGLAVYDSQSGLRAFRASLVPRLSLSGDGYEFTTRFLIDVARAKTKVSYVQIKTILPRRRITQYRRAPFSIAKVIREMVRAVLRRDPRSVSYSK